eukprot:9107189-Alexandrium_andersonii.AAC.1
MSDVNCFCADNVLNSGDFRLPQTRVRFYIYILPRDHPSLRAPPSGFAGQVGRVFVCFEGQARPCEVGGLLACFGPPRSQA